MNSKGFALIQVMVVVSIIIISGLGMCNFFNVTVNQLKNDWTNHNILTLLSQIKTAIKYKPTSVLTGQSISSSSLNITDPVNTSNFIAKTNQQFDNKTWTISSIEIINQTIPSPGTVSGTLTMNISKDTQKVLGPPNIIRTIGDVTCLVDLSNNITECNLN
jgi:hypothetical protein